MRVLINNPFFYPNMKGGAEQSVKLLAEGLVNDGHDVAIYCVDSQTGKMEHEEYNGVKVYRGSTHKFDIYRFSYEKKAIGKIEKVQQKLRSWSNKECVKDFELVCKDFKPDIVHSNGTYGMSQLVWKKAYQLGIPVIHTIRDTGIVSPVQYGHKAGTLLKLLHRYKTFYTTQFVTGVTAPSNYTLRTSLVNGYFRNAKVKECIFNSVQIDRATMERIITQKRERNDKKIKFMYAGRLVYFKGIEHMIQAFEQMKNKNCELHICGEGEMEQFVKEWEERDPRIVTHGKLNNQQLANVYDDCDVLLVPSFWPEPFGRVLIEGNLHGLPVIAGNCGGMPEIINITHGGMVYEPGNVKELTVAMDQMTNREKIRSCFNSILENIDVYDIRHQIKSYENIYTKLIEEA